MDQGAGWGPWVYDGTYLPSTPGFSDPFNRKVWDFADFSTTGRVEFGPFAAQKDPVTLGAAMMMIHNGGHFNTGMQVMGFASSPITVPPPVNVPAMAVQPLSKYMQIVTYPIPGVSEASGLTYSCDTDTLYAIGDEGEALVQITKTGETIDQTNFAHWISPGRSSAGSQVPLRYLCVVGH